MASALSRVAAAVRAEGGLLAAVVHEPAPGTPTPLGDLASHGPHAVDLGYVVEAVREGYELHHGHPRVVITDDPDLALLAGDRLYALGLARLAELGDLDAVARLAEVIATCARAHAEGRPQDAEDQWTRTAAAIGEGGARQL